MPRPQSGCLVGSPAYRDPDYGDYGYYYYYCPYINMWLFTFNPDKSAYPNCFLCVLPPIGICLARCRENGVHYY
jgi:hypothetical protein